MERKRAASRPRLLPAELRLPFVSPPPPSASSSRLALSLTEIAERGPKEEGWAGAWWWWRIVAPRVFRPSWLSVLRVPLTFFAEAAILT